MLRHGALGLSLLVCLLLSVQLTHPAYAGQEGATLPIKVTIIQCGHREEIAKTCEEKPACCIFVDPELEEESIEIAKLNACDIHGDDNGIYPHCYEDGE